ncbi:MAG: MarR family transcriptional regulator [Clostridia bacterium]|nr:MarR family transcriptional regulator [Clostridia bacterium]NLS85582.1 MarR family transcriptional regulator [Oscillospiraceae bacterium]
MLEENFTRIYTKFKLQFYSKVFSRFEERESSLSAVETFCVEVIYALGSPTVNEFAAFAQISSPNAAYKINSLVKKGYVRRVRSKEDRREFHLEVTDKYMEYYGITYDYVGVVMQRIKDRFPPEDVEKLDTMLNIVSTELITEVKLKETK